MSPLRTLLTFPTKTLDILDKRSGRDGGGGGGRSRRKGDDVSRMFGEVE